MRELSPLTNSSNSNLLHLLLLVLGLVVVDRSHAERNVTLGWNPVTGALASGYRVYCQEEGAVPPLLIDVGPTTSTTISGLKEGLSYSFTVTAYNSLGVESAPSDEAQITVPVPIQLTRPSSPGAAKRLRFPVAPGRSYEVQASTDLRNWTTIWQTGLASSYTWIEVPDLQSTTLKQRFYRLKVNRPGTAP